MDILYIETKTQTIEQTSCVLIRGRGVDRPSGGGSASAAGFDPSGGGDKKNAMGGRQNFLLAAQGDRVILWILTIVLRAKIFFSNFGVQTPEGGSSTAPAKEREGVFLTVRGNLPVHVCLRSLIVVTRKSMLTEPERVHDDHHSVRA